MCVWGGGGGKRGTGNDVITHTGNDVIITTLNNNYYTFLAVNSSSCC